MIEMNRLAPDGLGEVEIENKIRSEMFKVIREVTVDNFERDQKQ